MHHPCWHSAPLLAVAQSHGITPLILGDALEGEARDAGKLLAGMALSAQLHGVPATDALRLVVKVVKPRSRSPTGKAGRGGRNTELLLAAAIALQGQKNIWGLAGDTDGIDGTEDAAGAMITPDSLQRARNLGLDARSFLAGHDSYSLFKALDNLVVSGPTLTNVNDFRALLVCPS